MKNALFASLLRDQRQAHTRVDGSRGRRGWPFNSPRTRLAPNSALPGFGFARRRKPGDKISPSAGAAVSAATRRMPTDNLQRHLFAVRHNAAAEVSLGCAAQHLSERSVRRSATSNALRQPPVAQHRRGNGIAFSSWIRCEMTPPRSQFCRRRTAQTDAHFHADPTRRGGFIRIKSGNGATGRGPTGFAVFGERAAVQWAPDVQRHIQLRQHRAPAAEPATSGRSCRLRQHCPA